MKYDMIKWILADEQEPPKDGTWFIGINPLMERMSLPPFRAQWGMYTGPNGPFETFIDEKGAIVKPMKWRFE